MPAEMDGGNPFSNQYGVGYQPPAYQQPYYFPFTQDYAAAGDPNDPFDPYTPTYVTGVQNVNSAGLAPAGVNIAAYDPFAQAANDAQYQGLVPLTNTTNALGNTSTTTGYTNTLNPATGAVTGQLNNVVGQQPNVPTAGYSTLPPSTGSTSGSAGGYSNGVTSGSTSGYTNTANTGTGGTTSGVTSGQTGGGSVPGSGYSNGNHDYNYQSFWDPSQFNSAYTLAAQQQGINLLSSSPAAQLANQDRYRAYASWLASALQGGTPNNDTQSFVRNWISQGGSSNAAAGLAQTLMPLFQQLENGQLDPNDWRTGYLLEMRNNPSYLANMLGNVGLRTPGSKYLPQYLQTLAGINQVQGQTSALPYMQALLMAAGAR